MSAVRTLAHDTELDAALAASAHRPVFLFKHSRICPISTRADYEFARFVDGADDVRDLARAA